MQTGKFRKTQGKLKQGVNNNKFSAARMTTFRYISISKVDWWSANKLLIIFVTLLIILWKFVKTKFLRVINFEKWLIAKKGRKRPKKSCRPDADLDKLKRPNWSQTTKNGNTGSDEFLSVSTEKNKPRRYLFAMKLLSKLLSKQPKLRVSQHLKTISGAAFCWETKAAYAGGVCIIK